MVLLAVPQTVPPLYLFIFNVIIILVVVVVCLLVGFCLVLVLAHADIQV